MLLGESRGGQSLLLLLLGEGGSGGATAAAPSRDPGPSFSPLRLTSQNSHDHMLTSSILGPQEKEKELPLHGL